MVILVKAKKTLSSSLLSLLSEAQYMKILTKIKGFVKNNLDDIILIVAVVLISLLAFSLGFIIAKYQEKLPLQL